MHFLSLLTAATAFGATVFAAPAPEPAKKKTGLKKLPKCMCEKDALIVADTFKSLIRGYTKEQALAALTEDFVDYSSAVSIVINKGAAEPKDVTAPIFTSRDQFMEGHGKQQPIPFETLGVWHNCNGTVFMKWRTDRSAQGQATETAAIPVIGLVILETEPAEKGNEYNYRIHTIHSEFNSAAWLVNLGVFEPEGAVTPVPATEGSTEVVKRDAQINEWHDVGMI